MEKFASSEIILDKVAGLGTYYYVISGWLHKAQILNSKLQNLVSTTDKTRISISGNEQLYLKENDNHHCCELQAVYHLSEIKFSKKHFPDNCLIYIQFDFQLVAQ